MLNTGYGGSNVERQYLEKYTTKPTFREACDATPTIFRDLSE